MTDLLPPALVASIPHHAGLGNRLRFLLSAQAIADAESRNFYYHWPVGERGDRQFGARLDELWEYDGGTPIEKPTSIVPPLEFFGTEGDLTSIREDEIMHVAGHRILRGFGGEVYWGDLLANMQPTEEVMALVNEVSPELEGGFISVQVRAHPTLSPSKTLELSPVSWFIDRMQAMFDQNPEVEFFLSSDTEEARAEIEARFPDVISIPKSGGYNTRDALIESTADLVMLSRSYHILAPYWSSFAELGWIMGGKAVPLEDSQRIKR